MTIDLGYAAHRESVVEAVGVLTRAGVMSHTGHINFSCRADHHRMLLTAKGRAPEIEADGFGLVNLDGTVEAGWLEQSTRSIVGMHTAVYSGRPETGAVVHTHSPHMTAFAVAGQPLPCCYEPLVRRGQQESIPVVAWAPRGSEELTRGVAQAVRDRQASSAVLLANHGLLAFGHSPLDAAKLVVVLEEAAEAAARAAGLGGAKALPENASDRAAPPVSDGP